MILSEKTTITIIALVSICVGVLATFLYGEYEDDVRDFFQKGTGNSKAEEDSTVYFVSDNYVFGEGKYIEWQYGIVQVRVLEYKGENGLNYIVGEYRPFVSGDSQLTRVKVLLTRDDNWENSFEGLDSEKFEKGVNDQIYLQKTHDVTTADFWDREYIGLEVFKEKFKVGDMISMALPKEYPKVGEGLTDELCSDYMRSCSLVPIWDVLMRDYGDFLVGSDLGPEFFLVPYSFSEHVFTR